VYFSTDFNDVNERDPSVRTVESDPCYPPGVLDLNTTYYWTVDEVNNLEDPNIWPGLVWDFTTADHITVDNFNSYGPDPALRNVWKDSITGSISKNGAEVFVASEPNRTAPGNSMMYYYRNYNMSGGSPVGSTAVADTVNLEAGTDWTVVGVKALVLNFYGDPANGQEPHASYTIANDRMWVALEDGDAVPKTGIVRYDTEHGYDLNDVKETEWHEWNIDLADPCLADVNLANVAKLYIGFGGVKGGATSKYGAGYQDGVGDTVWFDDIQLFPPRCRSALVETDFTGDCITDYADVDIMARDWLQYDYNVPAVAISSPPIGWWKLDEGEGAIAYDSAGDNDGNVIDASWVAGYPNDPCDPNHALHFDGDGIAAYDRVICAERIGGSYPAELMPATFTVACWVKVDSFEYYETFVTNGVDQGTTGAYSSGFYLYAATDDDVGDFGLGIRTEPDMYYVDTPDIYETGTWYHLAGTYTDANTASVYVDGQLAVSENVGGPIRWTEPDPNNYYNTFAIGALPDRNGLLYWFYAKATIDDVRVYNYALSYGQIVTLAEQGPVLYHDLISPANIYDLEAKTSKKVNFRDYAILADHWLEGPTLWP
jgi:hypothetical protein